MTARPTSDGESPSASSSFLSQLRRSRRGSLASISSTSQVNKGTHAETLDQIHNTASQSDALTTFNEYTSPPSSSPGVEDKGITGELQGGLSGLYSRFRASVGNVKDIVTLSGEENTADENSTKSPRLALPTTTPTRVLSDPTKSPVTATAGRSLNGSRHSSRGPAPEEASVHDGNRKSRPSNLSSDITIGGSKAASGSFGPMKSPANLAAPAASIASPAVVEINVNAVKDSTPTKAAVPDRSNQDTASLTNSIHELHAEANLSSAAGQQKIANLSSRSVDQPDGKGPRAFDPSVRAADPASLDDTSRYLNGFSEKRDAKVVPSSGSSITNTSLAHKSYIGSLEDTQNEKRERSPDNKGNTVKATPRIIADPGTPQPPITGKGFPSEVDSGFLSAITANHGQQHMELPVTNSVDMRPTSPVRTPDLKLTRTSSKTTATTLVHASRHKPNTAKGQTGDPRSTSVVLNHARSKVLNREYWMRDENARDCFYCGDPFSTFRRKHHCRTCGQIFDAKCTTLLSGPPFGHTGSIRVCKPCESIINGYDDSSDLSDDSSIPISGLRPRHGSTGASDTLGSPIPRASPSRDDIRRSPLQPDLTVPTMAIPATRKAGGDSSRKPTILEIGAERTLARPSSSRSLKSSYVNRSYVPGHRRHHSRHLTQRGSKPIDEDDAPFHQNAGSEKNNQLPAFHDDNIIDPDLAPYLSDEASSGDEQMSITAALSGGTGMSKSLDHEKGGLASLLGSSKKGRSRMGDKPGTLASRDVDNVSLSSSRGTNVPRSSRRRNLSVASNFLLRPSPRGHRAPMGYTSAPSYLPDASEKADYSHDYRPTAPTGGPRMMRSSSMRGDAAPAVELNNASLHHVRKLLRQLLQDAQLQSISSWERALVPILLQATDDVNPDVQRGDDIDVRHYVKLKRIPGGRPGDTSYVSGLVFTKNVALKSMPRNIANPNILILTFALEYARHQQHFMSLEPVIRQEREYLQNLVNRIAALRPQLLLVQRNVSGLALELLEQAKIATAYNVKPSVLEAVSRCSQTRIISSIDKLAIKPAQAGTCSSFYLKTYVHNGRKKTYMFLSGCTKELGCTIVLRGADEAILAKVKRITEFMVYVVYNLKLETCLMRDEFALIPSSIEIGSLAAGKNALNQSSDAGRLDSHLSTNALSLADGSRTHSAAPASEVVSQSDVQEQVKPLPSSTEQSDGASADDANVPEDIPMPTFYTDMVEKHQTKILSASPFVKFMQPYLLMRAREQERRLAYLKRLRDQDCSEEQPNIEESEPQKFDLITPEMVHGSLQNASRKAREALRAVHDAEYDKALHIYQTQSRQWEAYIAGSINLFDPYAHQNIAVLYSVVCTVTTVPCAGPDLLALGFYNEHETDAAFEADCTLGQYVEELCCHASNICTVNGCERKMFDHHRQYVHGEAQLNVFVEPFPCRLRGLQETILMWSRCRICGKETQVLPMSEGTWKYSFGKYLEVSFWSRDLHARAGICPHDLHRDHLRYFGFKNVAVRVHYDPITLLEIIVPRARVTWKVDNDLRFKNDLFTKIEERINRYMNSVKGRIRSIKVETVVPEKADNCSHEIARLTKLANSDHQALVQKLRDKYMNSKFYEITPLNRAIRFTQEKVAEWDKAFAEFDRNYFPSEKDIRRLATLQLKKIFLERDESNAPFVSSDGTTTPIPEVILEKVSKDGVPTLPPQTRNMSPEKAHDMLTRVVEKQGSLDVDEKTSSDHHQSAPATTVPVTDTEAVHTSVEDLKRLKGEDVRHLDLAISAKLLDNLDEHLDPGEGAGKTLESPKVTPEAPPDPSATDEEADITPLGEGPDENALENPISKRFASPDLRQGTGIPRPIEGQLRRTELKISPPLLRAQSQPIHMRKDKSGSGSQDVLSPPQIPASNSQSKPFGDPPPSTTGTDSAPKPSEKKLSERLGLGVLKPAGVSNHSMIPRSITNRRTQSNVSNLAKHFEQLSREFERERLRERRLRAAKNRQSRVYPVAASRPIVEIYRNVHEAVEEREQSDEDLITSDPPRHAQEESPTTADHMAANMGSDTQGEGYHAEDTTAETTETDDNNQPDSYVGSDVEGEGGRPDDVHLLLDDIPTTGTAAEHHALSPTEAQLDLKLDLPKHEKTSLMKMLTNFWAERSASGWQALEYFLNGTDHVFADSDIIVREDEPSSLIAFALGSEDYQAKLRKISESDHGLSCQDDLVDSKESFLGSDEPIEVERSLNRSTGTHLKFQFQEGSAKMLCKVFFAEQFDALRRKCGVSERIVESLSRCLKWDSKGGKTKSVFLKTLDDRFVLKSLSPIETQAFLRFAPAYFQIMSESLFHDLPSVIAKMLGFYQIIIKNPVTGAEFNWFLLVMENLFYDRSPTRIFDLKGSMRNRRIQSTGEKNEVLLDENMVEFICESPLFVREHSKKLLRASVWNDTLFLSKQNVMDYSLMVAIDEDKKELVVGIIDCIRTYTWDKKLEFWIKDRGKNKPTVTSPRDYKNRFREAMGRYVLQAPNCWHHFSTHQPELSPSARAVVDDQLLDSKEAETDVHVSGVS